MLRERLTAQQQTLAERARLSLEEELVCAYSSRVTVLAQLRTGDQELARDLTQEVMLAVVCALRGGKLRDAERLPGFVYGTARNLINNYLRRRSRLPPEDPIDVTLHLESTPDPVETAERRALVCRALTVLNDIDRRILLLTLTDDLKPGEIAARLGLTSDAVRSRKSRALKHVIERVRDPSRT